MQDKFQVSTIKFVATYSSVEKKMQWPNIRMCVAGIWFEFQLEDLFSWLRYIMVFHSYTTEQMGVTVFQNFVWLVGLLYVYR
jgi:hypothetical protein